MGYALTGTCIGNGVSWRVSFIIQGFTMAFSMIVMCLIPEKYINIDAVYMKKREGKQKKLEERRIRRQEKYPGLGEIGGTNNLNAIVENDQEGVDS